MGVGAKGGKFNLSYLWVFESIGKGIFKAEYLAYFEFFSIYDNFCGILGWNYFAFKNRQILNFSQKGGVLPKPKFLVKITNHFWWFRIHQHLPQHIPNQLGGHIWSFSLQYGASKMISSCCMWKKWTNFGLIWDFFPKKGVTLSQILSESDQANFGYFCEKQKCSSHA